MELEVPDWAGIIPKLSPRERSLLKSLTTEMTVRELSRIDRHLLIEHIRYALIAREMALWKDQVSEEMFLGYVLPHRILQEPAEKWRKGFHEELYPVVKHLNTLGDAAMEVNRWAAQKATFKRRRIRRDHTPGETIRSGLGNCADFTILYIAACRSVGIPARAVFAPWLTSKHEGRHFWTEVWDGAEWCYVGSGEPLELNRAWFTWHVQSAAKIYAFSYQGTESKLLIPRHPELWVEDVTSRYTDVGSARVKVAGEEGAVPGCKVTFAVRNADGAWKPVATAFANQRGLLEMTLGSQVERYCVTLRFMKSHCKGFVNVNPNKVQEIELKLRG